MAKQKVTGGDLYYLHVRLPWGEKEEDGENEQVKTVCKEFPPSMTERVDNMKSAYYKALDGFSLTFPVVRGIRFVPTRRKPYAESRLAEAEARFWEAFNQMEPEYEALVERARVNLGPRFRPSDYPEFAVLRSRARCKTVCFQLAEASSEVGDMMGLGELLGEFRTKAYRELTSGLQSIVRGLVERLTEGKNFRVTSLDKFAEFLKTFTDLAEAVRGSKDLEADMESFKRIVAQAEECMKGVVPDDLRGKDGQGGRDSLGNALNGVVRGLDTLMAQPVGARRLNLGGTPPAPPAGQGNLFGE